MAHIFLFGGRWMRTGRRSSSGANENPPARCKVVTRIVHKSKRIIVAEYCGAVVQG